LRRVMKHRLFWPVAALVSLILINTVARPQFASITIQDGRFYGALIDILRNSAPLMLVSLGMTVLPPRMTSDPPSCTVRSSGPPAVALTSSVTLSSSSDPPLAIVRFPLRVMFTSA